MCSSSFLASPPKSSLFLSSSPSSSSPFCHQKIHKFLCFTQIPSSTISIKFSKRHLNLSVLTLLFNGFLLDKAKSIADSGDLQRYTDSKDGFTLLVPSSWIKVEKAGANVLFEEAETRSNTIGVVESTNEAGVVSVRERSGQGQQVYEFEYRIDSTRGGIKRVFSAAFVSSKKLYLLNVVHSDKPEDPLDSSTRLVLEQVLHSFDALPLA